MTRTTTKSESIPHRRAVLLAAVLTLASSAAMAVQRAEAPYVVIGGTVFDQRGFSLRGATLTAVLKGDPKAKKLQTVSDARGEFAFRVPAQSATWILRAAMKGFQAAENEASVDGKARTDVTFQLALESK